MRRKYSFIRYFYIKSSYWKWAGRVGGLKATCFPVTWKPGQECSLPMHCFVESTRLGSPVILRGPYESLSPLDWTVCIAATCSVWQLPLHRGGEWGPSELPALLDSHLQQGVVGAFLTVALRIKSISIIRTSFVICFWYTFLDTPTHVNQNSNSHCPMYFICSVHFSTC